MVQGISTSSSEDVIKGDASYFINCIDACNLDSFICAYGQLVICV